MKAEYKHVLKGSDQYCLIEAAMKSHCMLLPGADEAGTPPKSDGLTSNAAKGFSTTGTCPGGSPAPGWQVVRPRAPKIPTSRVGGGISTHFIHSGNAMITAVLGQHTAYAGRLYAWMMYSICPGASSPPRFSN